MLTVIAGAVFLFCVVMIARDDWAFRIVPDCYLLLMGATGAVYAFLSSNESAVDIVSGLAFRSAIPGLTGLAAAVLYRLLRGRDGLGLGDVKLMAAAGLWLPLMASFHAIAVASFAALIAIGVGGLRRGTKLVLTDSLPFAVFLAPAFWLLWIVEGTEPL